LINGNDIHRWPRIDSLKNVSKFLVSGLGVHNIGRTGIRLACVQMNVSSFRAGDVINIGFGYNSIPEVSPD